jgi:hypothetical protein
MKDFLLGKIFSFVVQDVNLKYNLNDMEIGL